MIKLTVNGTDITKVVLDNLISITVTDERDGDVDQLDIEIANPNLEIALPAPKAKLNLWLQDDAGELVDMGIYHVDTSELSGPDLRINITARSADITDSLRVRREVSYKDTTLGDMLKQIASRNALDAVIGITLGSIAIDHFDQAGESDLSVIERLGKLYDAVAAVKAGRLLFKEAGTGKTASGKSLDPVMLELTGSENWQLRLEATSYTGVTGFWNDKFGAKRKEVSVGTDVNPLNIGGTFRSEWQCKNAVDARWKQLQRAQSFFSITLPSLNPYAVPDAPLQFSADWPAEIKSQDLIITRIVHRISDGKHTSIEAELKTS
ncbi:contractile injection system protein, VgrG/Pvc8 family [Thalassolituus oleivorans]|uniref:contractile injection system protein, VgrG/Pvc8 family n=1 Tax=Thalassolituus oleivorans TaxID=187493 RepID=UPI0023F28F73|nr:contractile injection system protein, VgrG/Pvc8 family [Thalassolituus oleivorans]